MYGIAKLTGRTSINTDIARLLIYVGVGVIRAGRVAGDTGTIRNSSGTHIVMQGVLERKGAPVQLPLLLVRVGCGAHGREYPRFAIHNVTSLFNLHPRAIRIRSVWLVPDAVTLYLLFFSFSSYHCAVICEVIADVVDQMIISL